MLTSVVIPSFNEGEKLRLTVESLLLHTTGPVEIIVVDNGSTDHSSDFLLGDHDPRVTLVRSDERLGVVGARHAGAARARGEILAFSDAHMLYPEGWLGPLLAELEGEVGLVGPGITIWGEPDGACAAGSTWTDMRLDAVQLVPQDDKPRDVGVVGGGCHILRRDLFEQLGGYDDGMVDWGMEDQEFCLRLWTLGHRVRVVPAVRVQHYFREFVAYASWPHVTYNKLRLAFAHFSPTRITRCIQVLSDEPGFAEAFARVEGSDVWDRRAKLDDRRSRDAEWFCQTFAPGV